MRLKWLLALGLGSASFVLVNTGLADTFNYNYTASAIGRSFAFDFTVPTLISSNEMIGGGPAGCTVTDAPFAAACDAVTLAVTGNEILIDYTITLPDGTMAHTTYTDNGSAGLFTVGTHSTTFGSLTITDIPAAATPEPSGVLLLGTGMLSMLGLARRRLFS